MLAKTHESGALLPTHQHRSGQLVFAISGVMQVHTDDSQWTIPPQRALWVPARQPHAVRMLSRTLMRTIYIRPDVVSRCKGFPRSDEVHVLTASPLIKELVLGLFDTRRSADMHRLMVQLLLHSIGEAECLPIRLPMPTSEPLRQAAAALLSQGRWQLTLGDTADIAAMSERSFTRHFSAEVGMSFRAWRQHARLVASLDMLASPRSMKQIAHALGFASSAAYITAFGRLMGCTPTSFRASS
jgi:AraC-like DNA-binding protein